MKGQILLKVLEIIKDRAIDQMDFFNAILASGYGTGMGKIEYEYQKRRQVSHSKKFQADNLKDRKKRLRIFISKMKHDGLINETGMDNIKLIISNKGKKKLMQLKNKLPGRQYKAENQNNPVIISFDIPERLRRKRNWLREVIKNLGFKMVHQSVWMGKIKIPKALILDLEHLRILEFIEIFKVSKTGTLKKLGK